MKKEIQWKLTRREFLLIKILLKVLNKVCNTYLRYVCHKDLHKERCFKNQVLSFQHLLFSFSTKYFTWQLDFTLFWPFNLPSAEGQFLQRHFTVSPIEELHFGLRFFAYWIINQLFKKYSLLYLKKVLTRRDRKKRIAISKPFTLHKNAERWIIVHHY